MSKRALPALIAEKPDGIDFEVTPSAMQRWNPAIRAVKEDSAEQTISIYGFIGESWDGSGVTAARIAGALRNIGDADVTVNINSPGGSAFEGIAIYNLLRAHKGNVKVRVLGLAASAASIIAMAGDTIQMGRAAFLMIHNVLILAIGNRNDLRAAADMMEPIDQALAELYAARTGNDTADVADMMDKETWLGGDAAIEQGFADELMEDAPAPAAPDGKRNAAQARAELQAALARAGYSRRRQRELIKEFSNAMPGAGDDAAGNMPRAEAPQIEAVNHSTPEGGPMDLVKLKAEHPTLVEALIAEGMAAGATAERARIQAVEAQSMPGHGELINRLKFDGKTTGPEAAVQVLAAERGKLGTKAGDIAADAATVAAAAGLPSATAAGATNTTGSDKQADKDAPFSEAACKAKWDADAALRAEYGDQFVSYLALQKAQAAGRVRILGSRKAD